MTSGNEFSLIARFRDIVGGHQQSGIVLGSGDDCAVLAPPGGQQICVSVDTLVEGAHFPVGANPELIGYRALAVNLSDLAAMGATPWSVFVALTMQAENDEDAVSFVEGLASGFAELANQYDVALSGGNLARGPLAISVTVMGLVPDGAFLRRDGASPGDDVYVSGHIGQAGRALADPMLAEVSPAQLGSQSQHSPYPQDHPLCAYWRPQPRIELGEALRGVASAAIDVSDGLSADLAHIAGASGVGVELSSMQLEAARINTEAMQAGDDYELLFTAQADSADEIKQIATALDLPLHCLGKVTEGSGVTIDGAPVTAGGYLHF